MFALKRLLESLFLPPFGPLLLIVLGLLLMQRRPGLGRGVAWTGALLSFALMLPVSVERLLAPLESDMPALSTPQIEQARGQGIGAVVILGGGLRRMAPEYGSPTINRLTLERVRYGARVARLSGLPILVSGGIVRIAPSEAHAMAESLSEDFGLPPRWIEDVSENTEQNAEYSAALLKKAGIDRIFLVTHAAHMRRARAAFEAHGMHVVPAPTAFLGPLADAAHATSWLPSATTAYAGWYALHETAGLLQQRLKK